MMEDHLLLNGSKHLAARGRDFGLIHVTCKEGYTPRVAGVTKYGTRAALTWLLENPEEMRDKILVAVE